MLMPCISLVLVLAVVTVGLLVMTQTISVEGLVTGVCRVFAVVALVFVIICAAKAILLPILLAWIVWLKRTMFWAVIVVLGLLAVELVFSALVSRRWSWLSAPGKRNTGGKP